MDAGGERHRGARRGCTLLAALLILLGWLPGQAAERGFPAREMEFVVPFPPGGPADMAARIIAPRMGALLGVPAVVSNPPLTITTILQRDLPYRPSDFAPVGSYAFDASVVAVRPGGPGRTLEEVVEHARKHPGTLTYGSGGQGTVSHITMELVKRSFGLDIPHVPFQGGGPLKNAILGGHVQLGSTGLSAFGPLIRSGDLIPLVTTAARRVPAFPQIPTMAEKGFPEASLNIWTGLYVPAGTPQAVVEILARALAQAARDPAAVAAIERTGMQMDYRDPEATRRLVEGEQKAVAGVAEKLGTGQ